MTQPAQTTVTAQQTPASIPANSTAAVQELPQKKSHTCLIVGLVAVVLLICAVVAVVAFIIPITLNPAKNFRDSRDYQRRDDITQILNAVSFYASIQGQELNDLGTIPQCPQTAVIGSNGVDLEPILVDEYMVGLPMDPGNGNFTGTSANTGYTICETANNRVKIAAPYAEGGEEISVQR